METISETLLDLWKDSLGGHPWISDEQAKNEFFTLFLGTSSQERAMQVLTETLPSVAAEVRQELARGQ